MAESKSLANIGREINAMGAEPFEVRSSDGGDNRTGCLDQKRATGITATGNKSRKQDFGRDSVLKSR